MNVKAQAGWFALFFIVRCPLSFSQVFRRVTWDQQ